jgi:hypothetical protein
MNMNLTAFVKQPLEGKTSLSRVFWLYGVLGSLLYGALEFLLNPGNVFAVRLYEAGGFLLSVYVIVATYRCAHNCRSKSLAAVVRVSAIISLLLLPVLAYLEYSGTLDQFVSPLLGY